MATSTAEIGVLTEPTISSSNWLRAVKRNVRRNPVGAMAGVFCLMLFLLVFLGPTVAPYDANRLDFVRLQAPSLSHPLGTDNLARDMLSRILFGARNSLGVAFAAIIVSTLIGVTFGVLSGYLGGWLDLFAQRIVDVMLAYPAIVFVIFFVTIFGRHFTSVALAIGFILVPGTIRIVRSATIGVKHQPFIEAALSIGSSPLRIMGRHVLPNVAAPIIIVISVQVGVAILVEAAISFLGQGVSSATAPSWGRMLQETRPSWQLAWWTMIVPGAAISVAVVAFNMFGDALRDWLDPRLRGSR
jgi:peptide/nickel transport system permease protein